MLLALALAAATESSLPQAILDRRRDQLQLHQGMGLTTLGALALTGVAGVAYRSLRDNFQQPSSVTIPVSKVHFALAGTTLALYAGTAYLSLSAPQGLPSSTEGVDSVLIHKGLAVLHSTGIVSAFALGVMTANGNPGAEIAHQGSGFLAASLLAASLVVIALDF